MIKDYKIIFISFDYLRFPKFNSASSLTYLLLLLSKILIILYFYYLVNFILCMLDMVYLFIIQLHSSSVSYLKLFNLIWHCFQIITRYLVHLVENFNYSNEAAKLEFNYYDLEIHHINQMQNHIRALINLSKSLKLD